ncbi:MAG: AAA family ATPase, partial [Acidimicrobiales bacterium]
MIADRIVVISRASRLVHDVQAAAGPGCVVLPVDHTGDLEEAVERYAPYDVLIAGPLVDTRAGLARLARVHAEHPGSPIVMVLPTPPHSPLPDLVRVGASDLVELPYTTGSLRAAIRRALALATSAADQEEDHEVAPTPVPERLGEVFTVASPSGGCGKTFYSTNLAHYLSQHTQERVCLVDLDLQFGEVSAALRLKPRFTIADVMSRSEDEGELDDFIEEYLVQQRSGMWVLAAPREPAEADRISPPDVSRVIRALRKHFGYLVLDTSAQLSEVVLTAMDQSTRLICMATLDLPSMRNMRIFLETLEKLKIPTERTSVVLNKVEPDLGIKIEEANEILHHKIVATLPYSK